MASINYLDDNAGDYSQPGQYDSGQMDSTYSQMSTPGRQPGHTDSATDFGGFTGGYTPPNGNTGFGGGIDPTNRSGALQPTQPQYKPWDMGEFQRTAGALGGQYSGSTDDFVNHIFPQLSQQYQGLERFGSKGDKIRLPNGQVIDAVISAGLGGRGYNWNPSSPTSGEGYSSDPMIGQYIDRMNGLVDRLSQPQPINPTLQAAIDRLGQPQPMNATLQDAISKLQGMFDNPGYTDGQRALMRTNLQEPLESQRAASQQRMLGRASDRGLGLGSGVIEQEAQGIDQGFDRMLGEALRQMSVSEIGMQNQQRAGAAGGLASIGQGLQGQDFSALGQLAGIGSGLQGQELQALVQAMGGAGQMGMLPIQLLQAQTQAMNGLDNQNVPQQDSMSGLISLLMGLADRGENAYTDQANADGGFWSSIFKTIPGLVGAFSGGGNSGGETSIFPDEWYNP